MVNDQPSMPVEGEGSLDLSAKILIVDDEIQLAQMISMSFSARGFETWVAHSAQAAADVLEQERIDLMILDILMPGESGLEFCARARRIREVQIILLSALGSIDERITGLEAGADDYVVKPFSMKELALRADAVLRRSLLPPPEELLRRVGDIELNAAVAKGSCDGRDLLLTPSEFRLLWALSDAIGPLPWEDLYRAMGSPVALVGGREAVRTAVYRLRGKLDRFSTLTQIETVRGIGYRLR